jgi:hypothetical protein
MLVNTQGLQLYSFYAACMSGGLATSVALNPMSQGGLKSLLLVGGPASSFIFVPKYVLVLGLSVFSMVLSLLQTATCNIQ